MDKNPTIVITGATRGIGKATAIELIKESTHTVIGLGRDSEALSQIQQMSDRINKNFIPYRIDLSKLNEIHNFSKYISHRKEKIDVLINNAGAMHNEPFLRTSAASFDKIMNINLRSPFFLIQSMALLMNSGSHIVNITSMGGVQWSSKFPGLSAYSASKGALTILTEVLAEELKDYSISVNGLAFGAVATEMLLTAFPGYKAPIEKEEMAQFVSYFALHGQQFFNGKVLPVSSSTP
ncbi:MAG: SDR family oxidoreductase [Bacteroidales bacterium]|nr:SDR family oxidoreductase [Bacteroidales bacterium]